MPPAMLLLLVDGKVLSAAAAEERLVHFRHVLEKPLDVGPLPAQLALLAHLAGLYTARVVELHARLQTRGRDGRLTERRNNIKLSKFISTDALPSFSRNPEGAVGEQE